MFIGYTRKKRNYTTGAMGDLAKYGMVIYLIILVLTGASGNALNDSGLKEWGHWLAVGEVLLALGMIMFIGSLYKNDDLSGFFGMLFPSAIV